MQADGGCCRRAEPLGLCSVTAHQRGAAHVSLPGLLPAARSSVINRGNDLACCLCLVNSDSVFLSCPLRAQDRMSPGIQAGAPAMVVQRDPATCNWLL